MNQREVWENIAEDWDRKRQNQSPEAAEFLANKKGFVLDIGGGSGRKFTKIDGTLIGVDFSANMVKLAKKRASKKGMDVQLLVSDALMLPFKDNSFDAVMMRSVLPSIKSNHHRRALQEIKRVAKKNADVHISCWNKDQPRFAGKEKEVQLKWAAGGKDHYRYYYLFSKDELEALLKKHFKSVKVFGSRAMVYERHWKNLIATAKVRK